MARVDKPSLLKKSKIFIENLNYCCLNFEEVREVRDKWQH